MSKTHSRFIIALFAVLTVLLLAASIAGADPVANPAAKHPGKKVVAKHVAKPAAKHVAQHVAVRHPRKPVVMHVAARHAVKHPSKRIVAKHVAAKHVRMHVAAKHAVAKHMAARHKAKRAAIHMAAAHHRKAVHHKQIVLHERHVRAHDHDLVLIYLRHHHGHRYAHRVVAAPAYISREWAVARRPDHENPVRKWPNRHSRVIARVRRGTRLHIVGQARDPFGTIYYHVGLRDGRAGWINHVCVKFVR